ncbi:chitin deacetylase 7-like [Clytia hemisphaerica]
MKLLAVGAFVLLANIVHCLDEEDVIIKPEFCDKKPLYSPHPTNCGKYIICAGPVGVHILKCPEDLHWDVKRKLCNWKQYAGCDGRPTGGSTGGGSSGGGSRVTDPPTTKPTTTPKPVTKKRYERADPCDKTTCKLPNCACANERQPPKGLSAKQVPQMILISYEDGVNSINHELYKELFDGKKNPNGCPIKATFFVTDTNNDYKLTKDLYNRGHEIGVNTLTHTAPESYWKGLAYDTLVREVVNMRSKLQENGINNVKGFRNPFLQTSGDTLYAVLKDYGFEYDSSLATHFGQLWWPFTLDYSTEMKECRKKDACPLNSYPGLWEIPKIPFRDNIVSCTAYDQCYRFDNNKEAVFEFLLNNFVRHYNQLRAPYPLFGHSDWMTGIHNVYRKEGLKAFIQNMLSKNDVYFVTLSQAVEWMKNPTTLDKIKTFRPWQC